MRKAEIEALLLTSAICGLTACGGGGGGGVQIASTPPPIAAPTPAPAPAPTPTTTSTAVTILAEPAVGDLASVGVWANLGKDGEWHHPGVPTTPSREAKITPISSAADQPKIRYTSEGTYEVQLPGDAYDRLVHAPNITNPSPGQPFLRLASQPINHFTIGSSQSGFRYSAMASWWRPDLDFAFTADFGQSAFGVPTIAGSVPVAGSATYDGLVSGISDAKTFVEASNSWLLLPTEGTVALNFNFGTGALSGQMALSVHGGMNPVPVGTYAFAQTMFSPGSTTYEGKFDTSQAGFNFFSGQFTGPRAEETIGKWAVPFTLEGASHQAIGVWIAKKGN